MAQNQKYECRRKDPWTPLSPRDLRKEGHVFLSLAAIDFAAGIHLLRRCLRAYWQSLEIAATNYRYQGVQLLQRHKSLDVTISDSGLHNTKITDPR